ncbi:MAG: glycosyltransferase family 4 protein [Gammaproteobacteria bacterium]|nr:glycosyltransferase family 4 protein [Gammaproteobacteria bacterium]
MLSVLHILSSLNLGGAERITVELAKVQREQNIDAQILTLGSRSDFLVNSVKSHNIPLMFSGKGKNRLLRYFYLLKVFRKFDVIHLHSRGAFRFTAPILPFLNRTKVIYTRHGLFPDDSLGLKLVYFFLRPFIDYVTFVTESGLEVFTANHKWKLENLAVVRNGVFVPDLVCVPPVSPVRFGSVGRMVPVKGQDKLLKAAIELENKFKGSAAGRLSFELKFVGDGPLEPLLREQAKGITEGIVEFCGEEPNIEKIYEGIDVLVVTSNSEGLSMVIMEAMARGIPAIATDVGGNGTLVHDNETGLLVKEQSPEAICDAMLRVVKDLNLISRLGKSARNLIGSEFSLLKTHEAYLQCYLRKK